MHTSAQWSGPRRVNYKIVSLALLLIIIGMLIYWKPWSQPVTSDRTIKVSGSSTISATPDEFAFTPSYDLASKDDLDKKSTEVTDGLKKLGVSDSNIKITASSGGRYYIQSKLIAPIPSGSGYHLYVTVTVKSQSLAQKVQDYLATTSATGQITPQASFSTAKQKELENKARQDASKDARKKADQSANELGFKLGSVETVDDSGFDSSQPFAALKAEDSTASSNGDQGLQFMPGEDQLTYTITVSYYIK